MNNELNNMSEEMTKAENLIIPDSEFGDLIIMNSVLEHFKEFAIISIGHKLVD